jgi:hypothetical protein
MGAQAVTDKASRWRHRAEELRAMAEGYNNPKARADLLDLAKQWDRMPGDQERRFGTEGAQSGSLQGHAAENPHPVTLQNKRLP